MIVGIGVDVVDVERWQVMMRRSPGLVDKTLTPAEQANSDGRTRTVQSLAARFAVKEAVAKALGAPGGLAWHDCIVEQSEQGQPSIAVSGSVAAAAAKRGIATWHVSITHDANLAIAYVIAESR